MRKIKEDIFTLFALAMAIGILLSPPRVEASKDLPHRQAGTRAMSFLKIGIGAEGVSMGESQVALTDDLYASYWNPAGLANLRERQIGAMHNSWFEEVNHEFVGVAYPIGKLGTIALSAIYLSYGEIKETDRSGNFVGSFNPNGLAIIFSYAAKISENISFGMNAKNIREKLISGAEDSVISLDLGSLYSLPQTNFTLGVNMQHLLVGRKVKFVNGGQEFNLPLNFKIGAAYKIPGDKFTFAVDLNRSADNDTTIGFGSAIAPHKFVRIRSGYRYALGGGNELGTVSGITIGLGFAIGEMQVDYAFGFLGKLGAVHRLSLLSNF